MRWQHCSKHKKWRSDYSVDDATATSFETMDEEMDINDYVRRVREQRQHIADLTVKLENLEVEMAEESERCEEDLLKMDKLCHDIQNESSIEIERMKLSYEQEEIVPRDKRIRSLTQELLWSNEQLEQEKAKAALLQKSYSEKSSADDDPDADKNEEFVKGKEQLQETLELVSKQLSSVQDELKREKEEKEELIKNLQTEQEDNVGRLEMIDKLSESLQDEEKKHKKELETQQKRIADLEAKIENLETKSNVSKSVAFADSPAGKQTSATPLQSSFRQASLRRQNSVERRQKVIENSMQEMDDMIKTMRLNARNRRSVPERKLELKQEFKSDIFGNNETSLF